jgi:hypothetical protein
MNGPTFLVAVGHMDEKLLASSLGARLPPKVSTEEVVPVRRKNAGASCLAGETIVG